LKAYAQWIGRKVTQNSGQTSTGAATTSSVQANRTAQQLGVRSYITPAIEAWASVGNGTYRGADGQTTVGGSACSGSACGVSAGNVKFTAYQIGSNYYLSKRTNLYAAFGSTTSTSATTATPGSGTSGNQYAVGARHTF
jgi:predicted porin